jgi:hypothetical protein
MGSGAAAALACLGLVYAQAPAPTQIPQVKFARGQNVAPTYEGWLRNADGTFTFVFGYFNRNWEEELAIRPGPENKLEPGEVDRGQPTYFLPRRQRWVFRVQVPADWGNKELVWTITSNGRTEKAYAALLPQEEITERIIMTRGNLSPGTDDPNRPPAVSIQPVAAAAAGVPVTLTALASDDGLPRPRVVSAASGGGIPRAQSNTVAVARPRVLTVSWYQYRGPAKVEFDSTGPLVVANGQATTTARFAQPGVYVLRAVANDGALSVTGEVSVTVGPGGPLPAR